jgi:CO dehydrogenase maturation factor
MANKLVVAVCGKGGVGKTAFTAMLTKVLSSHFPGKLLVVDADPALGLHYALGRSGEKTIGSVRDRILKTAETGNRKEQEQLADQVDYLVAQALEETPLYSFLAMGRMDAIGCFCSINDLLKSALDEITKEYDAVLIDGEAGLEQINRQVVEHIDTLILVTDTSLRGMKTVQHIKGLVDEGLIPDCKSLGVIFNRVSGSVAELEKFAKEIGVTVLGTVPLDAEVAAFDQAGRSLMELPDSNPAVAAVAKAFEASQSQKAE